MTEVTAGVTILIILLLYNPKRKVGLNLESSGCLKTNYLDYLSCKIRLFENLELSCFFT